MCGVWWIRWKIIKKCRRVLQRLNWEVSTQVIILIFNRNCFFPKRNYIFLINIVLLFLPINNFNFLFLPIAVLQGKFARTQMISIDVKGWVQSLILRELGGAQPTATVFHSRIICLSEIQLAIVHRDSAFILKKYKINTACRLEAMLLVFSKQESTFMKLALLEIRTIILVKFISKIS